ncbi:MAG TPA: DUF2269 family protein [Gemmatimonadota bacterium]|nr:DUF2269 family protein [Gemmatimonadota bacterium]
MSYAAWKLLHVASVILFLGNITTGLFWAAHAHRSRDLRLIASTFEGISRSDRWFTIPGVIGIVAGGVAAAVIGDLPILATGWIFWPIILFSISGIVFGVWVAPLQRRIVEVARAAESSAKAWDSYQALYRRWEMWGLLALITPAVAMAIMVLKPSLPGL